MIARKILLAAVSAIVVLVGSSVSAGDDDKETKKLQTYQAELKTAADPVGVAIRMARDESALCAFAGMDELVNHWRDARAAKTLAELAARGPHVARCLITRAGHAHDRMLCIEGKHEYEKVMKGAATSKEKMSALRAVFAANPDWLNDSKRPNDRYYVSRMLIDTARDAGKAGAIDLIFESGFITQDDAGHFADALVAYFKRHGRAKVLGIPDPYGRRSLVFPMVGKKNAAMPGILEQWLKEAASEREIEELVSAIRAMPEPQLRLLKLLTDSRPLVVRHAVGWLRHSFPDRASLDGIRAAAERRRLAGADKRELSYYATVIERIEEEIANAKLTDPK